jgi:hypothetical protein
MEFILGETVYPSSDPQSDCAILLLFSHQGRNVGESEQQKCRRLV